jgi:hypothetical protein
MALSGSALMAALAEGTASAHVSVSLLSCTTKAVVGQAVLSNSVDNLVKGALKTMLLTKLKVAVGAVMVMAALGTGGLVYRASGQSAPAVTENRKPRTELEALRRENDLLKLNLEVVLEKVRAQEAELRSLRRQVKATPKGEGVAFGDFDNDGFPDILIVNEIRRDPLHEAEAALKVLREASDQESRRRAADQLEKALKKVREQLKKPEVPPAGK